MYVKRVAVNDITNTYTKTASAFSPHPLDQQWSPCCHNFLTVTASYHSKRTPICALHGKKIAEVVFLCVFKIAVQPPSLNI